MTIDQAGASAHNSRRKRPPVHPTKSFLQELSWLLSRLQDTLSEVIVAFSKEASGVRSVCALDFQILHAYLFPTLQRNQASIPPSLAAYIFERSTEPLLLPPGCVIETLDFTKRVFPLIAQFRILTDGGRQQRPSGATLSELLDHYTQLNPEDPCLLADCDNVLPVLASRLSRYVIGFRRLNNLIINGRLGGFSDYFPTVNKHCERELYSALHAKLSAYRRDPGRSRSNQNDAINMATVLSAHLRVETQLCRPALPDSSCISVQLLTATPVLLKMDLSEYGQDILARDVAEVLPDHVDRRSHSWLTRTPMEAAVIAAFKNAYGDPDNCLKQAKQQFNELWRLKQDVFDADLEFEKHREGWRCTKEVSRHLSRLVSRGAGEWYLGLRKYIGEHCAESWESSAERLPERVDVTRESTTKIFGQHIFAKLAVNLPSTTADRVATLFRAFNVEITDETLGEANRAIRHTVICKPTNELLLEIIRWIDRGFLSICWESRLPLEPLLACLNRIIASLQNRRGEVIAVYEVPEIVPAGGGDDQRSATCEVVTTSLERQLFDLSDISHISVAKLITTAGGNAVNELLQLPVRISIGTEIGDLHIPIPTHDGAIGHIRCHIPDAGGIPFLLTPLLQASHPWAWSTDVLDGLSEIITREADYAI